MQPIAEKRRASSGDIMLAAGAQRGLHSSSRCFTTAAAAQASALPAISEGASTAGGWLSKLFGGSSRLSIPLTDPLPGVDLPRPDAVPSTAPSTETLALSNGVTIASEATPGPTATLGLYINSGSVYEEPYETGCSHLLEYMAFKTTANRTYFRLTREVESIGAQILASASREQMAYNIDVPKPNVADAVEILVDSVANPKFLAWEVKDAVAKMKGDIATVKDNPQTVLLEGLHEVAYTGGLAKPMICPEGALGNLTADRLGEFVQRNYTASRMVLSGAGVQQKELTNLAQPLLDSLPQAAKEGSPKSEYVGGDFRQFSPSPMTHAMLAFEYPGGWNDVKGSTAVTVLQFLLGGGGSFSAGGPGKGMHSRLYRRVLNQYEWVHNCTAFSSLYNDSGLVGIFISTDRARSGQSFDIITKELQATAQGVTNEELERAKRAAIASVYMNLESRAVVAEDIGRQILTYGHRKPITEFINHIEKLTVKDISELVSKMVKKPPTVAVLGDVATVPRYAQIAGRFS